MTRVLKLNKQKVVLSDLGSVVHKRSSFYLIISNMVDLVFVFLIGIFCINYSDIVTKPLNGLVFSNLYFCILDFNIFTLFHLPTFMFQ